MEAAFAKHPAPNPQVEARRQQRLADCKAGKLPANDQGDETAGNGTPEPGTPPGGSGAGQPGASGGAAGGQQGTEVSAAPTVAPATMSAPVSATVNAPPAGVAGAIARAPVPVAVAPAGPVFTTLDVTVATGDDDLRANSGAWISVKTPDGFSKPCYLKQSPPAWDEHSSREVQCKLQVGLTADQLRAAQLILEYDGSPNANADLAPVGGTVDPFQTWDNWKVNAIQVTAMAPGQAPQCLINMTGSPQLVELKGDNRSFTLTGGC